MERTTSRRSPAIIVAVLALVAALAGTAIAGSDVTTSALTKKKVKKLVKKEVRKRVKKEVANQIDGADGADGAEVMLATLRDLFATGMGSATYGPVGESAPGYNQALAPSTFIATDLRVELNTGVTDPNSFRSFTLRVANSDTALACTIVTGGQSCSSDERVTVSAGDTVEIQARFRNTSFEDEAAVGWRAIAP